MDPVATERNGIWKVITETFGSAMKFGKVLSACILSPKASLQSKHDFHLDYSHVFKADD
jgi:hypothetical protein